MEGERDEQESYMHSPHAALGMPKKAGFSAGSGLRSIAQGSADQASSAVSNQQAAAKQAAYVAQNTLAQAASQAAATAQVGENQMKFNCTLAIHRCDFFHFRRH